MKDRINSGGGGSSRSRVWSRGAMLVLSAWLVHPAFALDDGALCQSRKLKLVGSELKGLLRCHSRAALGGTGVDAACLAEQLAKVATFFAGVEARGGCLTTGDGSSVGSMAAAGLAGIVASLHPNPSRSVCDGRKLLSVGSAASHFHMAIAKQRKMPNQERFAKVSLDFREDVSRRLERMESVSADCQATGVGLAVADALLAIAGDVTRELWPLSQGGVTFTSPPGFHLDSQTYAMSNGNVTWLANHAKAQMVPPGGADITVSRSALPNGPLSDYIDDQQRGSQILSTTSVTVGGKTGTKVVYVDDYEAGVSFTDVVVYVPSGSHLYRFILTYGTNEPLVTSFRSTFDAVLASIAFVP